MFAWELLQLMLTQVLDVFPLKCSEPVKGQDFSALCDFWKFKNNKALSINSGKESTEISTVLRCLWGTMSLCLGITYLVCDFHIILSIRDFSRPCSNTLLGKSSDILERVWLISKLKNGPRERLLPLFRSDFDQYWNVPFLTLRGGRGDGKGR